MPRGLATIGLAIALALIVAIAALGYRTTEELVETSRRVEHSHQVMQALDEAMLDATSAGRSRRTYSLTGRESEVPRVYEAMARAREALARGRSLTADNPAQQARIDRLAPLIERRFDDIDTAIAEQRASPAPPDGSREEELARRGNEAMSRVAVLADEATNEERRLLADRQEQANRTATFAKAVELVGTAVSVTLIVFAFSRVRRENRWRMQSQEALRASEERLATTLYSIGDGVIATDASGRIEHLNRAAEQLTGTVLANAVGKRLADVFHVADERTRTPARDPYALVLRDGVMTQEGGDSLLLANDGAERSIASNASPIRDASGSLSGMVLVFRDTTRQRADRRAADRATRFLDSIVEHIPDMIFVKEARELRFERLNRAGELLLGLSRDALIGKNDYDLFPKEQADFFQAKDRETLAQGVVIDVSEEPIETQNGRRWLHTKKVPLMDDEGAPRFLLGISEDITERKATAEALRAAVTAAESANRELEAFSYSVAHDLRAPLRSIDGFSQALLEDYSDKIDETGRKHLQRVRAATQRMGELIDGLLGLARLARADLRVEPVDLSALATAAVEELRQQNPRRDVEVQITQSLGAHGDPRILRVVVDNLLGNAFKFTANSPRASIQFGVRAGAGAPVYFVKDDGVGFDPRYADKLFGAFQRLHDAREFPGTGIGLATVQRAVRRHGGRVWAEGETGRGATFFFTLSDAGAVARAGE